MSANVFSARLYQKECSMATARSKVGWTASAHEVEKETFPSLPPGASSAKARAAKDEASRKDAKTAKARRLALMLRLLGKMDGIIVCPTYAGRDEVGALGHRSGVRESGRDIRHSTLVTRANRVRGLWPS